MMINRKRDLGPRPPLMEVSEVMGPPLYRWMVYSISHRIHGAAIYGNMDPINIPPMLAYHTWILWVYVMEKSD
jgi:hypothetical protein